MTGLGVGVLYHPTRTARWKGDAGMVHNGPIEVWIKFGILGMLVFLVQHDSYHIGQLSLLRKYAGLAAMSYA